MGWICAKCEERLDESVVKYKTFVCPSCKRLLTVNNVIKVGKHYFAQDKKKQKETIRIKRKRKLRYLRQQRQCERQRRRKK